MLNLMIVTVRKPSWPHWLVCRGAGTSRRTTTRSVHFVRDRSPRKRCPWYAPLLCRDIRDHPDPTLFCLIIKCVIKVKLSFVRFRRCSSSFVFFYHYITKLFLYKYFFFIHKFYT